MKREPSKVNFLGFTIVRLPDSCTRSATKFFREGYLIAVSQKNGNIAISGSNIFRCETDPVARFKVIKCLHALGVVGDAILAEHKKRAEDHEYAMDVVLAGTEAKRLGHKLIKLPEPKTVPKRTYRSCTK